MGIINKLGCYTLLLMALISCGHAQKKEVALENSGEWKTYDAVEYVIQYPDTFDLNTNGAMGVIFSLVSHKTSPLDSFNENVNLISQDLSNYDIDLDKYVEISEEQVHSVITDGNILVSKRLTKDEKEVHQLIYTGRQGPLKLKWNQLFWIDKNWAYVLTLTCEEDQYDNYVAVGEKIMQTFKSRL